MKNSIQPPLSYQILKTVPVYSKNEPFVSVSDLGIPNGYIFPMVDMKPLFKKNILVRMTVALMLKKAQNYCTNINKNWSLFLTYGYRSPSIQKKLFKKEWNRIKILNPNLRRKELYEKTHAIIAVPAVAGHPTGGAIDICLLNQNDNTFLSMGTPIYDFQNPAISMDFKNIQKQDMKNRLLLRNILVSVGFAPFDGEWWHFSYGDKEWAAYYQKQFAVYQQVDITDIKIIKRL